MKIDFLARYEKWFDEVTKTQKKIKEIKSRRNAKKWKRYYNENKEELNKKKMEYHKRNTEAYKKSLHKWYENLKKDPVKYRAYIQRISENRRNKRKMEQEKTK